MTTSGTYAFDLTVGDLFDEAFEFAGIDPEHITHRHITSAKNSINLLQIEIETEMPEAGYRVDRETTSLASGTDTFTLSSGTIDVLEVVSKTSGGTDIPMSRMIRDDYIKIPDKTATGRPTQYYVDHGGTLNAPLVQVYPVPDAALTITYDRMRWAQDVDTLSDTMDARRLYLPVLVMGLAAKIALKHNQGRYAGCMGEFMRLKEIAKRESTTGRDGVIFVGRGFGAPGRRRRR